MQKHRTASYHNTKRRLSPIEKEEVQFTYICELKIFMDKAVMANRYKKRYSRSGILRGRSEVGQVK